MVYFHRKARIIADTLLFLYNKCEKLICKVEATHGSLEMHVSKKGPINAK